MKKTKSFISYVIIMDYRAMCYTTNHLLEEIILEFAIKYYSDDNDKDYIPDIDLIDSESD